MKKRTAIGVFGVIGIALMLTATAAILPYFGSLETTVNVSQSVLLDGKSMPTSGGLEETINCVGGEETTSALHWLTNTNPSKDAIVSFDSTPNGTFVTIAPMFRLDAVLGQDNDDVAVVLGETTWEYFATVAFTYFIIESSDYENTPHVNIGLTGTDGTKYIVVYNEKPATKDIWNTVTFNKGDPSWMYDITNEVVVGSIPNQATFESVVIEVANGWGPIIAGQEQVVWVKNIIVNGNTMWKYRVHNCEMENMPARTLYFKMIYEPLFNGAGIHTIITEITHQGVYTKGGVVTP